jgi:hypothetical protein
MFRERRKIQAESLKENVQRHPIIYSWFTISMLVITAAIFYGVGRYYDNVAGSPVTYTKSHTDVKKVDWQPGVTVDVVVDVERSRFCPTDYRVFWVDTRGTLIKSLPTQTGGFTPIGTSSPVFKVEVPKYNGTAILNTHVVSYCPQQTYITSIPPVTIDISVEPFK